MFVLDYVGRGKKVWIFRSFWVFFIFWIRKNIEVEGYGIVRVILLIIGVGYIFIYDNLCKFGYVFD